MAGGIILDASILGGLGILVYSAVAVPLGSAVDLLVARLDTRQLVVI